MNARTPPECFSDIEHERKLRAFLGKDCRCGTRISLEAEMCGECHEVQRHDDGALDSPQRGQAADINRKGEW
jgi:hypothetical protein